MDKSPVVARVISPAYHYISSAYQLRSLGMTGIWKGSRDRSREIHVRVTHACFIYRACLHPRVSPKTQCLPVVYRTTEAWRPPPWGENRPSHYVYRPQKFLSIFLLRPNTLNTLLLLLFLQLSIGKDRPFTSTKRLQEVL